MRSHLPDKAKAGNKRRRAYRAGLFGELAAIFLLFFKGYRILVWRYKAGQGEVDILALKGRTLVAVEVKARESLEAAVEAVGGVNRQRVERAALRFMAVHKGRRIDTLRFDVVAVRLWQGLVPIAFRHLDNAWQSRT
ncbi:MAG: YraN family protein [Alphaproteobacteria bacterium]|nr:YraN family protein [Alphaproteobacteria bacterium]